MLWLCIACPTFFVQTISCLELPFLWELFICCFLVAFCLLLHAIKWWKQCVTCTCTQTDHEATECHLTNCTGSTLDPTKFNHWQLQNVLRNYVGRNLDGKDPTTKCHWEKIMLEIPTFSYFLSSGALDFVVLVLNYFPIQKELCSAFCRCKKSTCTCILYTCTLCIPLCIYEIQLHNSSPLIWTLMHFQGCLECASELLEVQSTRLTLQRSQLTQPIVHFKGLFIQFVWTARCVRACEVAMLKDPLPLAQYCSLTIDQCSDWQLTPRYRAEAQLAHLDVVAQGSKTLIWVCLKIVYP